VGRASIRLLGIRELCFECDNLLPLQTGSAAVHVITPVPKVRQEGRRRRGAARSSAA